MKYFTLIATLMICGIVTFNDIKRASAGEVLIIANPSVASEPLDSVTIKEIFLGDIVKWENNERIIVVISGKPEMHKAFLKKYIKRTETQFQNVWRRNMYSGKGMLPIKVGSIDGLVEYVSKTNGAIGYISSDRPPPNSVKILSK